MRIVLTCLAVTWFAFTALGAPRLHTTVDLLLPLDTVRPGDSVLAGVRLRMEPHWHTYWKNSGESGAPTEIEWQLPSGVKAGPIQWPVPKKLETDGLVTYVLENEAVLFVPLEFSADLAPGALELRAKVSWLECEELCIPGEDSIAARIAVGSDLTPSVNATTLDAARRTIPQPASFSARARWDGSVTNDTRTMVLGWPGAANSSAADFIPDRANSYEVLPVTVRMADGSGLIKQVKKSAGDWPGQISGVLVQTVGGEKQAFAITASFVAPGPGAVGSGGASGNTSPKGGVAAGAGSVFKFLLLALLGGMILNLMPCVLPILSLKILSVVNQRDQSAAVARKHSLVYALGVLVSFWIVAALVVVGRLATWGEQFQDARFIVIITALMTLVALNLFGVFEFVLPGRAVGSASQLAAREGMGGSFFNGVLAVVLGASCVAPMLAAAIGWAVQQPPVVIVLTFSCIGAGLALPYVALTFFPALQAFLPKPGAWMEKFKVAMGFPMLATAAWLFSLVTDHYGRRGVLWVGLFLVLFAGAAWIYGQFIQRGRRGKVVAAIGAAACLGLGYGYGLEHQLDWRHPNYASPGAEPMSTDSNGIAWQPWSPEAVGAARAAGRPVFVDFTANWCLTCQANKASSIEVDSVRAKLKEVNAVALLADYTRKSPAITAELKRFERAGVPLVLVFPKDSNAPPEILPTVLTPGIVLDALSRAGN